VHLHQRPGPSLGGQPTEQVIGNVNLPHVLSDLNALTQGRINQTTGTSSANGALQKTLRSSAFVADIGRDDHLLRRLYLRVNLVPPAVSTSGQPTQGLIITLDLAINPRPLPR
jgi:hypothetical protein